MHDLIDQRVDRAYQGSRFVLSAMRNWTNAVGNGQCPPRVLAPSIAGMGARGAFKGVHLTMAFFNANSVTKLAMRPNTSAHRVEQVAILTPSEDSLHSAARAQRLTTLDELVPDRSGTIGNALDNATAAPVAAELAPFRLKRTAAGSAHP